MANLVKITDKFYKYTGAKTGGIYTLQFSSRGRNHEGRSYFLKVQYPNIASEICIASFCVKDDGYHCYKEDYRGLLWVDMKWLLGEANKLIDKMEEA